MDADNQNSNDELYEATVFNADSSNGGWTKTDDSKCDPGNKMILDVVRRSLRERKRPQRTVYGVLVTDNFKTYKAYSTPFYASPPVPDYVLNYSKDKSQIAGTQTSRINFQRNSNSSKTARRSKSSKPKAKRNRMRQLKDDGKSFSSYVPVKIERPGSSRNSEKKDQYVYYYAPVLTRFRKKQLKRSTRHRE